MSIELPGVSREDIDIDVKERRLTVKGEKKLENSTEKEGYLRVERAYGAFERSFLLDESVDSENIRGPSTKTASCVSRCPENRTNPQRK